MANLEEWSGTDADANGTTGSPPDYASEGWAPSSVNAWGREVMRAVRAYYNDPEWRVFGNDVGTNDLHVITWASGTTFSTGASLDTTAIYHTGRRIRAVGSSTGTIYGTITSSTGTNPTVVTVVWDSGSLSNETLVVSLGPGLTGNPIALSSAVTLRDFGVVGSGGDESAKVQAAIDYATANNKRLISDKMSIQCDTALTVTSGFVDFDFGGSTFDFSALPTAVSLNEIVALSIDGSQGTAVSVTASVAVGDTSITVADSATFTIGEYVFLYSADVWPVGASGGSPANRGAIYKVIDKADSTHITLDEGCIFAHATTINARPLTMIASPIVRNASFTLGGVGEGHSGVSVTFATDVLLENVSTLDAEDTGIFTSHINRALITGGSNVSSTSSATIGNTGYGVLIGSATRNIVVQHKQISNCRHGVAGGGLYPALFADFSYNTVDQCGISTLALDCHEDCAWWNIHHNTVTGGGSRNGGAGIRGDNVIVADNVFINSQSTAIQVQKFETQTTSQFGIEIRGNKILKSVGPGILFGNTGSIPRVAESSICNNEIYEGTTGGIILWISDNVLVSGNLIKDCGGGAPDGDIRLVGDVTNFCTNITLNENRSLNANNFGVTADYAVGLTMTGHFSEGSTDHAVELTNCDNVTITGGYIESTGAAGSYGVLSNSGEGLNISGVRFVGSLSNATSDAVRTVDTNDIGVVGCEMSGFRHPVYSTGTTDRIRVAANGIMDCSSSILISAATTTYEAGNI